MGQYNQKYNLANFQKVYKFILSHIIYCLALYLKTTKTNTTSYCKSELRKMCLLQCIKCCPPLAKCLSYTVLYKVSLYEMLI